MTLLNNILGKLNRSLKSYEKGRNIDIFPDDSFIVSYPKSGNTWLRFMLDSILGNSNETSYSTIERTTPDIYRFFSKELNNFARPRILKSHEPFDHRYKKIVYLHRDPRNVAISYFHHLAREKHLQEDVTFDNYLKKFLNGEIDSYGNWGDHIGSWFGARENQESFFSIAYEDLLESPQRHLIKICEFLGIPTEEKNIKLAVISSSPDKMKAKYWNHKKPFVRSLDTCEWEKKLTTNQVLLIEEAFSSAMERCNYRKSSR